MYYRVKRSNVNTESCHGCRVVRPSPSPPSLSLWPRGGGVQQKRERGGRERSSWSVICVLARTAVFLQSALSVNASYLWAGMLQSYTLAHTLTNFHSVLWEWICKLVVKSETLKHAWCNMQEMFANVFYWQPRRILIFLIFFLAHQYKTVMEMIGASVAAFN